MVNGNRGLSFTYVACWTMASSPIIGFLHVPLSLWYTGLVRVFHITTLSLRCKGVFAIDIFPVIRQEA